MGPEPPLHESPLGFLPRIQAVPMDVFQRHGGQRLDREWDDVDQYRERQDIRIAGKSDKIAPMANTSTFGDCKDTC